MTPCNFPDQILHSSCILWNSLVPAHLASFLVKTRIYVCSFINITVRDDQHTRILQSILIQGCKLTEKFRLNSSSPSLVYHGRIVFCFYSFNSVPTGLREWAFGLTWELIISFWSASFFLLIYISSFFFLFERQHRERTISSFSKGLCLRYSSRSHMLCLLPSHVAEVKVDAFRTWDVHEDLIKQSVVILVVL